MGGIWTTVIVHHMEPDHSATPGRGGREVPDVKIVCNAATKAMMEQFFPFDATGRWVEAKEGARCSPPDGTILPS